MSRLKSAGSAGAVVFVAVAGLSVLMAQQDAQQNKGTSSDIQPGRGTNPDTAPRNLEANQITITGSLVDLRQYMIQGPSAAAETETRTGERGGVDRSDTGRSPIVTPTVGRIMATISDRGLIILSDGNPELDRLFTEIVARPGGAGTPGSSGTAGSAGTAGSVGAANAGMTQKVQLTGTLYQRDGVKFLDVTTAQRAANSPSTTPPGGPSERS